MRQVLKPTTELFPHRVGRIQRQFKHLCFNPLQHLLENTVIDEAGKPPGAFALHPLANGFAIVVQYHDGITQCLRQDLLVPPVANQPFYGAAEKRGQAHIRQLAPAEA